MRRREFITLAGSVAWTRPLAGRAQQAGRMRRVAILMPYPPTDAEMQGRVRALRQELAKFGWAAGVNIQFDERWTTDNMDLVRANASGLLELNPDVVVATGGRVIPIVMQLTQMIPIVIPGGSDPVGVGWVKSIARPGGNVTGFAILEASVFGKALQLLKEIVPNLQRVALIFNPDNPNTIGFVQWFESYVQPLDIEPVLVRIHSFADIERAVAALAQAGNGGILFPLDVSIQALREQIIMLVAQHQIPAAYLERSFVSAGGLLCYAADPLDSYRGAASYVDRILRGEKPADLPYQQPTKYKLSINLKAARAIGIEFPVNVLALFSEQDRAVIEPMLRGLEALGYVDGKNVAITYRSFEGDFERLPKVIGDLIRLNPDVIFSFGGEQALIPQASDGDDPDRRRRKQRSRRHRAGRVSRAARRQYHWGDLRQRPAVREGGRTSQRSRAFGVARCHFVGPHSCRSRVPRNATRRAGVVVAAATSIIGDTRAW
jgi:putative tryptophan/tyrosine transport system substrate-binding protein